MSAKTKVRLSASKINALCECTLKYWFNYIDKLPQEEKDYFAVGTLSHLVLECLQIPKRKEYYDLIIKTQDVYSCEPIRRLIKKHIIKYNISHREEDVRNFIITGLNFDFFCEGCEILHPPEYDFKYDGKNFEIIGFIDKCATYKNYIKIIDYKTSKSKFDSSKEFWNIQGLVYALVGRRTFGVHEKYVTEFQFLKFSKNPSFVCEFTNEDLDFFERYLEFLPHYMETLTFEKAQQNTPYATKLQNMLCGALLGDKKKDGTQKHVCPYKYPFDYYAIYKEGKIWKTSLDKNDLLEYNKKVYKKEHKGCPIWSHRI